MVHTPFIYHFFCFCHQMQYYFPPTHMNLNLIIVLLNITYKDTKIRSAHIKIHLKAIFVHTNTLPPSLLIVIKQSICNRISEGSPVLSSNFALCFCTPISHVSIVCVTGSNFLNTKLTKCRIYYWRYLSL